MVLKTKDQKFQSAEEYDTKLAAAMPKWEGSGVRGFWAKISLEHAHVTSVFAKYGLDFHHAQSGYVMMAKWLPTSEPSMVPEYANQYLGVAGFVVNEKNQLLVIQEKYHPGTAKAKWKLPGGHSDKGEEIFETAQREVREETGIETEFVGIISFRHQQNYRYGCSDFYFICVMRPINSDQKIQVCEQEIANCKWVDIDEYLNDPDITDANRYFTQCYKDSLTSGNQLIGASPVQSFNRKTTHQVYSIQTPKHKEHKHL
ncbi:uncharacterized protein LOC123534617 isoform X2 [Mercenaria mercenaria]|nr:uncharacterized protein LOC123534617 isoform X2 [Mercenaria mercenaria]